MELPEYKALVAQLLSEHYSCSISDTHLTDPTLDFARLSQIPAYEAVNQQAIELDLRRTDLANGNAYPRALLGNVDQYRAIVKLSLQSVRAGLSLRETGMTHLH